VNDLASSTWPLALRDGNTHGALPTLIRRSLSIPE